MRVAGMIMECNPFHEGHRYIIEQAKKSAEALVVVMSGDFVQRGAPAILSKERRTRDVLEAGADLVLELPVCYACSGAEYFARAGVTMLSRLGAVTDLYFGVSREDPDFSDRIWKTAGILNEEPGEMSRIIQAKLRQGASFPAARAAALKEYAGVAMPKDGNDLLGIEYCRTLLKLREAGSAEINVHTVPRINVPSATEIRRSLLSSSNFPENSGVLSFKTQEPDMTHSPELPVYMDCDDFSQALMYQLSMTEDPGIYADVSEDLSDRILSLLRSAHSITTFSAICDALKTRNLTYTRVSRALLHILLQIRKTDLQEYADSGIIGYARILGFRRNSQHGGAPSLISLVSDSTAIPLITALADAVRKPLPAPFDRMLQSDIRSGNLYDITAAQKNSSGITPELRKPMIIL